jgi:cytochrome c
MRRRASLVAIGALTAGLSGTVCMLSSPSCLYQKLLSQARADEAPEQVFNNACRTCHTVKEGDNRLGPNLYKIFGRKAGSLPDYDYSSAMKEAGFVWDEAKLARLIADPDEVMPGNKMKPYSGLASADDRKKVIAFLLSMSAR